MTRFLPVLALACAFVAGDASAWSAEGHRIVAHIADAGLSPAARAEVERLLAGEADPTLAGISTWADELRDSDPELGKRSAKWHYINFDGRCGFEPPRDCKGNNCIVTQTNRVYRILADSSRDTAERAVALKFVVHLVGDLHQPMHASPRDDKGGNEYQVNLGGDGSNLHRIWDGTIIKRRDLAAEAYADVLLETPRRTTRRCPQTGPCSTGRWSPAGWSRTARSTRPKACMRSTTPSYARLPLAEQRLRVAACAWRSCSTTRWRRRSRRADRGARLTGAARADRCHPSAVSSSPPAPPSCCCWAPVPAGARRRGRRPRLDRVRRGQPQGSDGRGRRRLSRRDRPTVRVSYAASSALARQIAQGAPADVFVPADAEWMDALQAQGLVDGRTRTALLGNTLVLVAPATTATAPVELRAGVDLRPLLGQRGRIAMGLADSVPAGRYAKAAFTSLGVWETLAPHVAGAENVRAALMLVARGEAPLGVVYGSDARAEPRVRVLATFPPGTHPPIVYPRRD